MNKQKKWYDRPLATDSHELDLLSRAVQAVECEGMSLEIGLRRGGGTVQIMKSLNKRLIWTHVAIDPYGTLPYMSYDDWDEPRVRDYTNAMRDETLALLYKETARRNVNFLFFNLTDKAFFEAFPDGVPVYEDSKETRPLWAFAHIDGPHTTPDVAYEFTEINKRATVGTVLVFDDIKHYAHDTIEEEHLFPAGYELLEKGKHKASYKKVK